ncbi:DoxX family protein [Phycisphaerales bacterium AB-hyl4]|uniref:DoxX family protein n=1 Tax=Natronomicrosphaera hydrolytica TaxID=3242702 RepID=A0ABV4U002_9BACT
MRFLRWLLFGGWLPNAIVADLVLTAVRIFTGLAMALAHGLGKVTAPTEEIAERAARLSFPMPTLFGWAAALSEFVGGLLLALGLLTRLSAFFILCTMTVAVYSHVVVREDPFRGYELALLFWFLCLQFLFIGSGRFGIDRFLRSDARPRVHHD